jgi:uncharacterized protein
VRTCLGCRKRDRQAALVRLVAAGDRVVVDVDRVRPGRGAWVHVDRKCVSRLAVGAVERGLKRKLAADALAGVAPALLPTTVPVAGQTDPNRVQLPPASPAQGNGTPE